MPESHGRDLGPLLREESGIDWRDDQLAEDHGHRVMYAQRILWYQSYKYVFNPSDRDELYDLETDTAELCNRIDEPELTPIRTEMRRRLRERLRQTGDRLGPQVERMLQI